MTNDLLPNDNLTIEVCIDSVESAIASQQGGAQRVELCDNLLEGGTTPSAGAIQVARDNIDIGLQVMIRPRGGDFCYSDIEFAVMQRDVEMAKQLGADGVVFGLLTPDGAVDIARTRQLVELARPLPVTFHRAFDMTADPYQALEDLIQLGIDRVLTSGQEPSVLEGLDLITDLVKVAADRIIVMPGAGITLRNVHKILNQCKAREIHIAESVAIPSHMQYRNPRIFMGGELRPPEYSYQVTDAGRVRAMRDAASG